MPSGAGKAKQLLSGAGKASADTVENMLDVTAKRPMYEILTETTGEAAAGAGASLSDNPFFSTVMGLGSGAGASAAPGILKTGAALPSVRVAKDAGKGFLRPGQENPTVGQRFGGAASGALENSWASQIPRLLRIRSENQLRNELNSNLSPEAVASVNYAADRGINLLDTGDPELHSVLNYILNDPSFAGPKVDGPAVVSSQLAASMKRLRDVMAAEGSAASLQDLFKVRIDADKAELSAAVESAKNRVLADLEVIRNNPDGTPRGEQADISRLVVANLQKAYDAAGKQEDQLWQQVPDNARIDVAPLVNTLLEAKRKANANEGTILGPAASPVERAVKPVLDKLKQQEEVRKMAADGSSQSEIAASLGISKRQVGRLLNEPVNMTVEYRNLRGLNTILNDLAASAASPASPQGQQNLLRGFATKFRQGLDESFDATLETNGNGAMMPEEAVANLRRAREYTRAKYQTFQDDPTVRRLIDRNSYAEAETDAAAGLQSALGGVRAQKMSNAQSVINAARFRSVEKSFADDTVNLIKDYLRGDFVRQTVRDEPDMPIDQAASRRWIDANKETLELFPDVKLEVEGARDAGEVLRRQKDAQKDLDRSLSSWEDPQGYGVLSAIVGQPASRIGQTIFTASKPGSTPANRMDQVLETMRRVNASESEYAALQFSMREFLAQQAGLLRPEDSGYAPIESLNPIAVGRALDYVRRPTESRPNPNREVLRKVFTEDELDQMELSLIELRNLAAFQTKNTDQFVNFLGEDEPSQVVSRAARVAALRGVGPVIGGFGTIQTPQYLADSVKGVSDKVTTGVKRKLLVDMIADPRLMQEALTKGGRNTAAYRFPFAKAQEPRTNGFWSTEAEDMFRVFKKSVDEGGELIFPDTRNFAGKTLLRSYLATEASRLSQDGDEGRAPPQLSPAELNRMRELYGPRPGQRTTR
jgi:hypothetical protein